MSDNLLQKHNDMVEQLKADLVGNTQRLKVKKKTVSNLFRYTGRAPLPSRTVDLSSFNQPLHLNKATKTLDVQGLTTYEDIVNFILPLGFLPTITPELKHITIGGATVGIGIETNSYRYGFVHDGLIEAEVLLPDGRVVVCSASSDYSDLFWGLPNSYGTLGYILRVKIKVRAVKRNVHLHTKRFDDPTKFLRSMKAAAAEPLNDYVESLIYSKNELYLTTSRETNKASGLKSIYGGTVFYKEISRPGDLFLSTKDYIFRYDPEWFWAIPETPFYRLFRRFSPSKYRNSAFYTHYVAWQTKLSSKLPFYNFEDESLELLIQDWEVVWEQADKLLRFALSTFDLDGRPLMAAPLRTFAPATSYPMQKNKLYFNLGSYSYVKKKVGKPPFYNTKTMDDFCFSQGGIKMLYSSSFLNKAEFGKIYGGESYINLKQKYDPKGLAPTLFEKVVRAH